MTSVGDHVEKLGPSSIAGGNVKWCSALEQNGLEVPCPTQGAWGLDWELNGQ